MNARSRFWLKELEATHTSLTKWVAANISSSKLPQVVQ